MDITQGLQATSVDELNDFALQLGWDVVYTQLGHIERCGSYLELVGESLVTTRETLPSALSMKTGGFPGHIAIATYLSGTPANLNGMEMRNGRVFIASSAADIELFTRSAGDLLVALVPESELETRLGEAYSVVEKQLAMRPVYASDGNNQACHFDDWFKSMSQKSFLQDQPRFRGSENELKNILIHSLFDIVEQYTQGEKHGERTIHNHKGIGSLIDYLHANPKETISIDKMVRISGLQRRSLFYNFKAYTGYTPLKYFNRIRLGFCRREISRGNDKLTTVALNYNFHHLGEFSAFYKAVYGELPSDSKRSNI